MRGEKLVLSPPRVISGSLVIVAPPYPFVVIAEGWPGLLVSISVLNLPCAGAFYPPRFRKYFKGVRSGQHLPLGSFPVTEFSLRGHFSLERLFGFCPATLGDAT